jgi:integrase
VQRLLAEAAKHRNTARWVIALALGLRQGEVLGLQWADVDFVANMIRVRRGRLRPRYQHDCGVRCGRKPGYCPKKVNIRRETNGTKTRAGKRPIGVPDVLMRLLLQHKREQDRERVLAPGGALRAGFSGALVRAEGRPGTVPRGSDRFRTEGGNRRRDLRWPVWTAGASGVVGAVGEV